MFFHYYLMSLVVSCKIPDQVGNDVGLIRNDVGLIRNNGLEGNTLFEDGYFAVAALFVVHRLTGGDGEDEVDEAGGDRGHSLILGQDTGVKVYPVGFVFPERGVCRYLCGGDEGAEGGAAAGGEKDHLAASGSKGRGGHEVVSGGR